MVFVGGDYRWLDDDGVGGHNLDARTMYFYGATVNTPAMMAKMVGKGSQYAIVTADKAGIRSTARGPTAQRPREHPREGLLVGRPLRPADALGAPDEPAVPQQEQHARQTDRQRRRFGRAVLRPEGAGGQGSQLVQSVAGKGWFALLRLYGPLEPWFEKTWQPGEIEEVK